MLYIAEVLQYIDGLKVEMTRFIIKLVKKCILHIDFYFAH